MNVPTGVCTAVVGHHHARSPPRADESASIIDIHGLAPPETTTARPCGRPSTSVGRRPPCGRHGPRCGSPTVDVDGADESPRPNAEAERRPPPPRRPGHQRGTRRPDAPARGRLGHAHALEQAHLEAHRRLHLGGHLHHRVGGARDSCSSSSAQRGHDSTWASARGPLATGQHAERQLGQLVGERVAGVRVVSKCSCCSSPLIHPLPARPRRGAG